MSFQQGLPSNMQKIILATHHAFWHQDRGDRNRIASLVKCLETNNFDLHVFFLGALDEQAKRILQVRHPKVKIHWCPKSFLPESSLTMKALSIPVRLAHRFGYRPKKLTLSGGLDSLFSIRQRDFFARLCRQVQPEAVIIEYISLAFLLDGLDRQRLSKPVRIIDTHDVMSQRTARFEKAGCQPPWMAVTVEQEASILNRFDVILAIQTRDKESFKEMLPGKRILLAGHVANITPPKSVWGDPIVIGYIATANDPNRHAITTFLKEVWPGIYQKYGARVRLEISGKICEGLGADSLPHGVRLCGYIDDLERLYAQTDLVINPVSIGSGLKIKIVEAICHSLPLVTTSVGAEGLEQGIGSAFCVCDSTASQYEALCRLIENRAYREEMASAAFAFAQKYFNDQAAYSELVAVFNRCK